MANPQIENGYTRIANELFDALIRTPLGNSSSQVIYAIMRKTYGWNKKSDKISINQLCKLTNCSRRTIIYTIQNLEAKRVIKVKRSKKGGAESDVNNISINKNYDEWVVQEISPQYRKALEQRKKLYHESKNRVVQEIEGSARNGKRVVQETVNDVCFLAPTKDTLTKDTLTKDIIPYVEIVSYLNEKTGKNFKHTAKTTRAHIRARWNEGARLEDFKKVIDCKCGQWLDDTKMAKYLRPETLFGTRFESYVNEDNRSETVPPYYREYTDDPGD